MCGTGINLLKKIAQMIKKKTKKNQLDRYERIVAERKALTKSNRGKAVIWTRVSSEDQYKHNFSIDTQKNACTEYCIKQGKDIKQYFGGTFESAKVAGEGFLNMVGAVLNDPEVDTIVVIDYDRFSRNLEEGMAYKGQLNRSGVSIVAVNQPVDQSNTLAKHIEAILLIVADIDNAMRKQKCYAGMVACIKRGEWFAKPPLGYTSKKVNRTHQLTINEEGRILKLAWEWVANEPDISQAVIVERLKNRGLSINKQHLSACLRNSFYCGRIEHSFLGGEIIEGKQEKLISPALFDRVQEILNSSNHAGYEQAAVTPRFPLKNHVRAFGHVLSGYTVKKKDLDYYKYSGKEGSVNVSAKVMHAKYAELLNEFTVPEELIPILTLVLQQKFEEKEQVRGTEVAAIKKHIATLKTEIKTVKRNYALDKIDEETYRDVVGDMNEKLRKAEAALEIATIDLSNLASYIDTTIEIACNLGTYWLERDFETCQKIQNLVFPEGVQWDAKTKNYLTDKTNLFFDNIRSLSMSYKDEKIQKKNKSCDLSSLVAGGGLEPPASGL